MAEESPLMDAHRLHLRLHRFRPWCPRFKDSGSRELHRCPGYGQFLVRARELTNLNRFLIPRVGDLRIHQNTTRAQPCPHLSELTVAENSVPVRLSREESMKENLPTVNYPAACQLATDPYGSGQPWRNSRQVQSRPLMSWRIRS